jgi:PAS domain S-box-containing protein
MNAEKILKAISKSAGVLFAEINFGKAVRASLGNLGKATGVSRVYLFENHTGPRGQLLTSKRYEWVAAGILPQIANPELQNTKWSLFPGLRNHLREKPFCGVVCELPPTLKRFLEAQRILSVLLVPVYVNGSWYGFVGFDDCATARHWTEAETAPLQIAADMLGGAIERRRHEERLRNILEDGIDSLGSGFFIIGPDCKVIWMNRKMEEIFGVSRRRIIGRDMRRFIKERIDTILLDSAVFKKKVLATYKDNSYIERLRCEVKPGGKRRRRILQHWSTPIRRGGLAGGRVEHYVDSTEVEETNAALRVSEKKYRDLVEKMNEGMVHADENMVFKYVNASFCRMLGYQRQEMLGRSVLSILDERGIKILKAQLRKWREGFFSRYEIAARAKDGEIVPFEVSATPVFDEDGVFRGSYAVFSDMRERKKLERMSDELIREASHALKAPTAKIKMGLDLLKKCRKGRVSDDERLGMAMIDHEVERMRRNIESLTDFSAFEAGRIKLRGDRIELCGLLRKLTAGLGKQALERGVALKSPRAKTRLFLKGDREKIYILFRNIIENAIKFSKAGTVRVSARRRGKDILVAVKDAGRGVEPVYLEKMFERYFQRYPRDPGAGLGLTLCRKIVELNGGRIWAASEGTGKGMTIYVALPSTMKTRKAS